MTEKLSILQNVLGAYYMSNTEYLFKCPYCGHHKNKLSVNVEKGVYKCWICDARGKNLYRIIRKFGSIDDQQRWKVISGTRTDLTDFESLFAEDEQEEAREQILEMPPNFVSLCNKNKSRRPLAYLKKRGIDEIDILRWKIGYCSGGPYDGRIIIPSFNASGDLNYFVARTFTNDYRRYLNPSVSRDIIFNELYLDFDEEITIVEGVFDAIKTTNAVPILGSTIRENSKLFRKIAKHDTPVLLALDPDAKYKSLNIKNLLLKYGIQVREMTYPQIDKDLGDMTKEEVHKLSVEARKIKAIDSLVEQIMSI